MILARTPKPAATESLLGYVLRVSEANGYETPWHILRLAGVAQGEMDTAGFPVDKFAGILGEHPESLGDIAYSGENERDQRKFRLLRHPLGGCLNQAPLRQAKPALCPACVIEHGYVDAFFDLKLAVACPVHRQAVVSQCPACRMPLSLFRPGLLTCKCGASLADATPPPVSPAVTALMAILKAKLHGYSLSTSSTDENLPVDHLLAMPLRAMLVHLPKLARFNRPDAGENMLEVVEGIAEALADWPNGFHRLLRDFATRIETTAYQKRFGQLSRLFFKVKSVREDFHWLHHEFLRYGLEQASDSIIHPRMLRGKESERRFISQSELASRLGVSPVTLRKWDDKGLIAMRRIDGPAGPRYVADAQAIQPPLATENDKILEGREAAAVLKLPVSILARIKADGHFLPTHRIKFKGGYHQADVDAFLARLLAISPYIAPTELNTRATVSLSHALRKYRMHDSKQKASLVIAYLSGELRSIGRTGETTEDILFKLEDVTALVASSRTQAAGGAFTQKEAAQTIECDPQAIPALLSGGHLESAPAREGTRITQASVERFAQTYVPLGKMAKDLDSSSRRLIGLCDQSGISLLRIPRTTDSDVPFIQRSQQDALVAIAGQQPSREQMRATKVQMEHPAVVALRSYLAGLQHHQEALPRRAGQPNKNAISRACGFSRDVLYDNAEAIALLAMFCKATNQQNTIDFPILAEPT